jgi:hypothetical protein
MSLKVAILLCGHTRTFDKTYQSFLDNFLDLDYDVFCHTWSRTGHGDPVWWSEKGDDIYSELGEEGKNKLIQYYNPKKIQIDQQKRYLPKNSEYLNIKGFSPVKNMWETVWRANELRKQYEQETGMRYDCVLKTRYDISYEEKLSPKIIEDNILKYKFNFILTHTGKVENLYNDSIYFSTPENFDKVIDTMKNRLEDFLYASIEKFKVIEGEASFTEFLRKEFGNDLEYNRFIYKCGILRLSGKYLALYPG